MRKETFFYFFNVLLLYLMTAFIYYPRNADKINTNVAIVYAILLLIIPWLFWIKLKKYTFSSEVLIFVQFGILLHFLGGIAIGGNRVYDQIFFSIRYDKIVHFVNCVAGYFAVKYIFDKYEIKTGKLEPILIISVVVTAGCVIELIEYLSLKTLPVSYEPWANKILQPLYDNNLQDILANFLGAIVGYFIILIKPKINSNKK